MKKLRKLISQLLIAALMIMQFSGVIGASRVYAASVTELENLTLSGGTFDSGITINQNYSIQITFSLTNIGQYANLFSSKVFTLRNEATNGLYARHGWYNGKIYKPSSGESVTVLQKKNVTFVNGSKVQTATKQTINDTDTFKFGNYKGTIGNVRIWNEADTLVADFIPVLDGSGKACMYNKVKGQYHYYSGNCIGGKKVDKAETSETDKIENSIEVDHTESKQEASGTDEIEKEQDTILDNSNAAESDINYAESLIISGGYFDSGMTINQDYSLEMTFALSTFGQYTNLYYTQGTNVYVLRTEASSGLYARHGWYNEKVYQPKADEEITILQKKNVTYVNEKQVRKATLQKLQSTTNLYFGNFKGTIKSFRIWNENGKLVGEYLPAQDRTGKPCMYDTVSKKYIYYTGTCKAIEVPEEISDKVDNVQTPVIADEENDQYENITDNEQKVYQILKDAMLNNSSDTIDISEYGVSYEKFEELWDMVKNDCFLEYHAHGNNYPTPYIDSKGNMKCFYLRSTDNYQERVLKLKEVVRTFLATVDSKMTDLDKILLAHEYVVNNVQYSKDGTSVKNTASGALVDGAAVCGGYTDAMVVLLHYMDIDTDVVNSGQMNHEWLYVKLGENWYHIDPTWDNTRQGANGSKAHWYLLRNDSEFQSISSKHYSWTVEGGSESSTSKEYTSWFVHDVSGNMAYYNGLWYYVENDNIVASTIVGTNKKTIVSCGSASECVKIGTIENGKLTYYVGNVKKVIVL